MSKTDAVTAASLTTTATELVLLSQSESPLVRARVAENPNAPLYLLAFLVQDAQAEVRMGVAANPKVTTNLLEWLMQDPCPDVRYGLAEDHNLPIGMLTQLAADENPYVAARASTTLARIHATAPSCAFHYVSELIFDRKAG